MCVFRFSGSGGHCVHLIKQNVQNSCNSLPVHPKFRYRVSPPWRVWMASRNSKSIEMIVLLIVYHLLTLGMCFLFLFLLFFSRWWWFHLCFIALISWICRCTRRMINYVLICWRLYMSVLKVSASLKNLSH